MPTLVMPSGSGMNQNQPWSNQKMVMLPAVWPLLRWAPAKCPYTARLLCLGFLCLIWKRLDRKVSRPEASITKRGWKSSAPSVAWRAVAAARSGVASRSSCSSRHCSNTRTPARSALRSRISSNSERRTW